ncbi:MAG: polyhydroxyalkanoate synthase [Candidatus Azotimanducaceae bacterium]|jgi:polyhydroxyalkanoate synthase
MSEQQSETPDNGMSLAEMQESMQAFVEQAVSRGQKSIELANAPPQPVGLTPKELLYSRGTMRLYHYEAQTDEVYRVPVLLVMATTNKAFIFDLAPGRSMIEYMVQQGFDMYVLDWQAPTWAERGLTLKDYTQDFIPTCVEKIQQESGVEDVSIIGYCMGGVLSLIYAATHTDGPLKNLVCLATPVNNHTTSISRVWNDPKFFDVDYLVDTVGILSAESVTQMFEMQRPAQRLAGQLRLWDQMLDDDFVDNYRAFNRWGEETLPLAGEFVRETTKELNWGNKLFTGELMVDGKNANLANLQVPLLSCVAQHDHLAPRDATECLLGLVGSEDKEEVLLKGGHVSLIAGPNAAKRMYPRLNEWLALRSV